MVNEAIPEVSIAIRAFRKNWLGGAIDSVLAQTFKDFELIIYDDAGDLEEITMAGGDRRIRYVRRERDRDESERFDVAVKLCRGKFIGLLDDDDRYEPVFIERLRAALLANERAGGAYCWAVNDCNGMRTPAPYPTKPGTAQEMVRRVMIDRWLVTPSALLMRRAALDEADRWQPVPAGVAPDLFNCLRFSLVGWEFTLVDEPLLIRGWHPDQHSKGTIAFDIGLQTFEKIIVRDPAHESMRRFELSRRHQTRAFHLLCASRRREALHDLRASRASDPNADATKRRLYTLAASLPIAGPALARAARAMKRFVYPPGTIRAD
jgi:hypothetical protein